MALLQKEKELQEIVQLIGEDALPDSEKIVLRVTRLIRKAFLQQNACSTDSFCPIQKQYRMLKTILHFHRTLDRLFHQGATLDSMMNIFKPQITEINNFKWMEKEFDGKCDAVINQFDVMTTEQLEIAA